MSLIKSKPISNCNTNCLGRFEISIWGNIIFKKNKNNILGQLLRLFLKNPYNFKKYKNIIENSYRNKYYGKYTIPGYMVEKDGSYKCEYIEGYRLDKINNHICVKTLSKIKKQLQNLKYTLNQHSNKLQGDWATHNLIYSIRDDIIYNIDLEGFYSEPKLPSWGTITKINEWLDDIIQSIKINFFTLILWNPIISESQEILSEIPNILETHEFTVFPEDLDNYIYDIYQYDKRCTHKVVLPPKISKLKKFGNNHIIVRFQIKHSTYIQEICQEVIHLKHKIRTKYQHKIPNYSKGLMIHIADDMKQSEHVWKRSIGKQLVLVQIASNSFRYRLTRVDDQKNWLNIGKMITYNQPILNMQKYWVYKISNPTRYYLLENPIKITNIEFKFHFYSKESELDPNICLYKSITNSENQLNQNQINGLKFLLDNIKEYVLLRGFEKLHLQLPLLKEQEDIDILVTSKDTLQKSFGNTIFTYPNSNTVIIQGNKVKFDRRYLGDNYYDTKWQQDMLSSKIPHKFFYIMNPSHQYYATLYHGLIHKGTIHSKYEKGLQDYEHTTLLENTVEHTIKKSLSSENLILYRYYKLLCFMIAHNYTFVIPLDKGVGFHKNKYKLNLFIIRKKGLQESIIEYITSKINKNYQIIDTILVTINNHHKFYEKLYSNFHKYQDNIKKHNDNQCLAIITNNPINSNPNILKEEIRRHYKIQFPPQGNIIHSSDTSLDCEKELYLLLNENTKSFRNIGTYYSQVKV